MMRCDSVQRTGPLHQGRRELFRNPLVTYHDCRSISASAMSSSLMRWKCPAHIRYRGQVQTLKPNYGFACPSYLMPPPDSDQEWKKNNNLYFIADNVDNWAMLQEAWEQRKRARQEKPMVTYTVAPNGHAINVLYVTSAAYICNIPRDYIGNHNRFVYLLARKTATQKLPMGLTPVSLKGEGNTAIVEFKEEWELEHFIETFPGVEGMSVDYY